MNALATKERRPWGCFEILSEDTLFKIKRIKVDPGAALSLQRHSFRNEHWIVVEGTGRITLGENERMLGAGANVHIPAGTVHRLANDGPGTLTIVEVQTGVSFAEEDIERLEDRYGRV